MNRKELAAVAGATLLISLPAFACVNHSRLEGALQDIQPIEIEEEVVAETPPDVEPVEETETEVVKEPVVVGTNLTSNEEEVLKFLQDRGIKDKAALATILGNIKQESGFNTTICEGGKKTGYKGCYTGGFGLIQWTTVGRYDGLGYFSKKYGLDPNTLEAQLRWMVNEREWLEVEHIFKSEGLTISQYNRAAYRWLGWGILGNRLNFANAYYSQLRVV